jgi:hypothetical protein
LKISAQDQRRSKGIKKNSVMKVVNRRGELRTPFAPTSSSGTPHCVPILIPTVLDRSHNLRMVSEGRTIVTTILV